jgi:hypothetical protein
MKNDEEKITYLLEMKDGSQRKICIPTNWVLTFGALIPGSQNNNGRMGLRIRKGQQQMAVFQDVESFRNTAIEIEERITTVKEETFFKGDGENRKAVVVEGKVHEWVNPDAPRPQAQESVAQLRVVNLE